MRAHGTNWAYQQGCRCRSCKNAHTATAKRYRVNKGMDCLVSVIPSRARLNRLNVPNVAVAKAIGLSVDFVSKVRVSPTKKYVRTSVEQKILALAEDDLDPKLLRSTLVPGDETRELVSDLTCSGFSHRAIGRKAGIKSGLALTRSRVRLWNAKRIESLYRKTGVAA
jgi:hypothetical protein